MNPVTILIIFHQRNHSINFYHTRHLQLRLENQTIIQAVLNMYVFALTYSQSKWNRTNGNCDSQIKFHTVRVKVYCVCDGLLTETSDRPYYIYHSYKFYNIFSLQNALFKSSLFHIHIFAHAPACTSIIIHLAKIFSLTSSFLRHWALDEPGACVSLLLAPGQVQ